MITVEDYAWPAHSVVVFRDELLPLTQTFVRNQVSHMRLAKPLLLGTSRAPEGLELSVDNWTIEDAGPVLWRRARAAWFKLTGRSRQLRSHLLQAQARVVVAHFAGDGYRISRLCQSIGLPLVVVCHGSDVLQEPQRGLRGQWGVRRLSRNWPVLARRATLFLPVCNYVGDALIARGVPPEKVVRHYVGTSLPVLAVDEAIRAHRQSNEILFVGRLIENKGAALLIQALDALPADANWHATIVGDGPLRWALQAQVATAGLDHQISIVGARPHEWVLDRMQRARILCAPSIRLSSGAAEGLSTVAVEAQARALPVVAFRTGGLTEAVRDRESGLLVDAGDVQALARALAVLLKEDDTVGEYGRAGRARAAELFDIRRQTAELDELLQRLVEQGPEGE